MRVANILVTPEQLQSVSSQLNAGQASIESTLGQLATQVAPLHNEWQGAAQAQFESLWAEWQQSAKGIAQLTSAASVSYGDTESSIAASFSR